jgi:SAM-dependent MidA family methyltransferase
VSQFKAGLRREPGPSLDVGDEPELVERLRSEIRANGPITFARFMQRALYEPELGYYRRLRAGPGREGDFLTAPETHPVFGRALARQLDEIWQVLDKPAGFTFREHGAGTGALALSLLEGLEAERSDLLEQIRYQPFEVEGLRIGAIRERLGHAGFDGLIEPARGRPIVGVVFANELLDALPVHRVVGRDAGLRELMVAFNGERFVDVEAEPSTAELVARLGAEGVTLEDGQVAEVCLELDGWIDGAASALERGILLLIDYGHLASELYSSARRAGTLMAYVRHRAHDDPFVNVGRQDITTHVDITAVRRAAEAAGLRTIGVTTQAEFLTGLGMGDLLSAAQTQPGTTLESYLDLRASVVRLLDPRATGAFHVMAFGRGLRDGIRLKGFEYRLPTRSRSVGSGPT